MSSPNEEVLLLKVLGLTLLVAGIAEKIQVSAAVGAFLITKLAIGFLAAARAGLGLSERIRAGAALVSRVNSASSSPAWPSPPASIATSRR